jgi:CCR4-NOT transcriptional complex subunit CAF120
VPGPGSGRNQPSSQEPITDEQYVIDSESLQQGSESGGNINPPGEQQSSHISNRRPTSSADQGLDEYKTALEYLASSEPNPAPQAVVPTEVSPHPPAPPLQEMAPSSESPEGTAYRSSFAPSKQAAERKARSEAHQAAHHAAVHKPGRSNGKRRAKNTEGGAWNESSEEEEEEEEEDDDVDSDVDPANGSNAQHSALSHPVQNGHNKPQTQMPVALPSAADVQPAPLRPVRHLPQIPTGRSPSTSLCFMQRFSS